MKKTTAALLGAILIASTAHAQYQLDGIIRDGVVGGVIGGVIGNNTGDRDGETGALIGAVSGVTSGVLNRRYNSNSHPRSGHTPRYYSQCFTNTPVFNSVWVKPVYNYDVYGNPFVIRAGYWKQIRHNVQTPCNGCGRCR